MLKKSISVRQSVRSTIPFRVKSENTDATAVSVSAVLHYSLVFPLIFIFSPPLCAALSRRSDYQITSLFSLGFSLLFYFRHCQQQLHLPQILVAPKAATATRAAARVIAMIARVTMKMMMTTMTTMTTTTTTMTTMTTTTTTTTTTTMRVMLLHTLRPRDQTNDTAACQDLGARV